MTIIQAIILGLIQGIAEFLPISSSGHLVLLQNCFGLTEPQITFDVLVHFATLLAVIIFFWKKIIKLNLKTLLIIGVANIPTVLVGIFLKDYIENIFIAPSLVSLMLLVTAGLNFFSDKVLNKGDQKNQEALNFKNSFWVGIAQALAVIPGISRSGSTVFAGLQNKLDRKTAFEFSFLLGIPAVAGATLLEIKDLIEMPNLNLDLSILAAGFIMAFFSGLLTLSWFKKIINSARLEIFAWYCLIIGIIGLASTLI